MLKSRLVTSVMALACATSAIAQPLAAPAAPQPMIIAQPAVQVAGELVLPANTELTLTPNSLVSSKTVREGDVFAVSTVYDVLLDNHVVIPRGTRGQDKVTWRTGKGAFGKSAKMDVAFEWIELGGRRIAVEGKHRQEGEGNTAATIGAVLAVGVFGAFVTGKSATLPQGMHLKAYTVEPIGVRLADARPAPQRAAILPVSGVVSQGTVPAVAASQGTADIKN